MLSQQEVIAKVQSIINEKIACRDFLDVNDFLPFASKCLVIVSYKGTGKTTSMAKTMLQSIKEGYQGSWWRMSKEALEKSDLCSSFKEIIYENFPEENWIVRPDGVYFVPDEGKKSLFRYDNSLLKIRFGAFSVADNYASQTAIQKQKYMVLDEIICPSSHPVDLISGFKKLISTFQRKMDSKIICLANAHENNNDILIGLNVDFDWFSGKTQVIYRPEQGLLALFIQRYEIAASSQAEKSLDNLFMFDESSRNFSLGRVEHDKAWSVKNFYGLPDFDQLFKPLFIYDYLDKSVIYNFAVGSYNDIYCVKQIYQNDYPNLVHLCYRSKDKRPTNHYVYDEKDMSTVKAMINWYNSGKLLFSCCFARDVFVSFLLPLLKGFLDEEKAAQLFD